jgi:hypothetical protein
MRTRCHWVEDAVGLDALCVANEDPWRAPVIELADLVELLDERQAAKDAEVPDRLLAPVQASYGVLPSRALVGKRLRIWMAVITASPK